jgi:hypothetical protein
MDLTQVKNKLGEGYKDYVLEGIKFTATFSIQGKFKLDDKRNKIVKGTEQKKIKGVMVDVPVYETEFDRIEVKHTFDFTGCTLGQVASCACAGSSLVVMTANEARDLGEDAVRALDGSTSIVRNMLDGKVRVAGSPKDKLLREAEKMSSEEDLEAAIAQLEAIKARKFAKNV